MAILGLQGVRSFRKKAESFPLSACISSLIIPHQSSPVLAHQKRCQEELCQIPGKEGEHAHHQGRPDAGAGEEHEPADAHGVAEHVST